MLTATQTKTATSKRPNVFTIEDILLQAGELAALPQVILKLIDLTSDPKVSAVDVERVIQTDSAVTARVLTLANSSYYGLPRRISSVREAVVFLGFKSVRTLAMAVTAFNMFLGKRDNASIARRDLWKHSLNTALCTRVVYKWLNAADAKLVDPDAIFTAGLLHDMGKMALEAAIPDRFAIAHEAARNLGLRLHEIECDYVPFSHAVVGSAMADRWSLPDTLCDVVLNHHSPLDSQINPQCTAVVSFADELAQGFHDPITEDDQEHTERRNVSEAVTMLQFDPDTVLSIVEACKIEIEKGVALS